MLRQSVDPEAMDKSRVYSLVDVALVTHSNDSIIIIIIIIIIYCFLLYRHKCFTVKYTTRKIHKNYIRDPSGLFSINSHVSLLVT